MKLFIAVDAPGPAEFIAPVVSLLQKEFAVSLCAIMEPPAKILAPFRPLRADTDEIGEAAWRAAAPDAFLVGTSSLVKGPYVIKKITALAHATKKPIICFQDFWANHRWPMNKEMMPFWDAVLVPDALAKQLLEEDGYSGEIFITGNPAFDALESIDVLRERVRLRAQFNIPENEFVILYAGTGTPQSAKEDELTFRFLADGIRAVSRAGFSVKLIARPHPRDINPQRYHEYAPDLSFIDTAKLPLAETALPLADVVISMYGTNLIHACFLRIPAISILLPNAGRARLAAIHLDDFPLNMTGATIGVYTAALPAFVEILEKIIRDPDYRARIRKAQDAALPPHSSRANSARAVAEAIKSFLAASRR